MTVSVSVLTTFSWAFNFLVYTVNARVAQAVGAGDRKLLGMQIRLALSTALVLGVLVGALLYAIRALLFVHVMGASDELVAFLEGIGLPAVPPPRVPPQPQFEFAA